MENTNELKYLVIFNCNKLGFPLTGWKIYNSQKEWEEVLDYHRNRKTLDFKLVEDRMIRYDSLETLLEDIDAAPVISRAHRSLSFMFDENMDIENKFGYYPL